MGHGVNTSQSSCFLILSCQNSWRLCVFFFCHTKGDKNQPRHVKATKRHHTIRKQTYFGPPQGTRTSKYLLIYVHSSKEYKQIFPNRLVQHSNHSQPNTRLKILGCTQHTSSMKPCFFTISLGKTGNKSHHDGCIIHLDSRHLSSINGLCPIAESAIRRQCLERSSYKPVPVCSGNTVYTVTLNHGGSTQRWCEEMMSRSNLWDRERRREKAECRRCKKAHGYYGVLVQQSRPGE